MTQCSDVHVQNLFQLPEALPAPEWGCCLQVHHAVCHAFPQMADFEEVGGSLWFWYFDEFCLDVEPVLS